MIKIYSNISSCLIILEVIAFVDVCKELQNVLFQILFLEMITFKCAKPNNPGGIHITVPGLELKQQQTEGA